MMMRGCSNAEEALNLPPGFRFHPTDEELVVHYLCRKAAHQFIPVPIIAEVDLYKYDPWLLPEKALFGQKEWYFFTPRDRKYPNGSRPNRAAGSGYWKATGADKPVVPSGSSRAVGIKKALVFYVGKAPKGTKSNWIMHEYRLADTNHTSNKKGSLRLDDWVLCRLYNKKNNWEKERQEKAEQVFYEETTMDSDAAVGETTSDSHRTPESDVDNDVYPDITGQHPAMRSNAATNERLKEESDWFTDFNLEEFQNPFTEFTAAAPPAIDMAAYPEFYFSGQPNMLLF